MLHSTELTRFTRGHIVAGLIMLALLLTACSTQPSTVAQQPETFIPTQTIIAPAASLTLLPATKVFTPPPPTAMVAPTSTAVPPPTNTPPPTQTSSPTTTPAPTETPAPTSTPTPRPDAGWKVVGGPNILSSSVWGVNYNGGKDTITAQNGGIVAKASSGGWFAYENKKTAMAISGPFVVDMKISGTGDWGIVFYGRSATGEWWQGLRQLDIGYDGGTRPVIGFRDGKTDARKRYELVRLDPQGMTVVFSADGSQVDLLDLEGKSLLRGGAITLSSPMFPDKKCGWGQASTEAKVAVHLLQLNRWLFVLSRGLLPG